MARALGSGYGFFPVHVGAIFAAIFGILGLGLVAVGLYGVVSYTMSERTQEIGVRMALGASPHDVLRLTLIQGMTPMVAGIDIGLPGTMAAIQLTSGLLFGITASDPSALVGAALFLVTVALAASYVPARRAMRIDPMTALRHE